MTDGCGTVVGLIARRKGLPGIVPRANTVAPGGILTDFNDAEIRNNPSTTLAEF